jgi:hypothetical protein
VKIARPSPATVIACLALFVALAGTASAARDQLGAHEIKQLNVREQKRSVSASSSASSYQAVAHCRASEQFMGGGGGWTTAGAPGDQASVVSQIAVQKARGGPPRGYLVTGTNPAGLANTLVAQAYCLPK